MEPYGHICQTGCKTLSFVSILTHRLRAIVRSSEKFEVRILRPVEFEKIRDAMDPDTRKICTSLLLTGMRYAELQRFRENPDWLDGKFVYLPRGSMLKVKAKQRERAIRLSDMGKTLIQDLFLVPHPLPELPALDMKLKRLSKRVLEGATVNNKTFRKTWESWLVFYYPEKALQIALSQGHTTTTQYEHYLNIPFDDVDRKDMRKWVEGWI
jgi:integrase